MRVQPLPSVDALVSQLAHLRDHHAELKTQAPVAQVLTWVIEHLRQLDVEGRCREFMDTRGAADRLGVTRKTIQNWCNEGRFPGAEKTSPHGVWRIPVGEVHQALRSESGHEETEEKLWRPSDE